ncbi:dihydrolipoamide acetyltransferase family protein [Microbacterium sp. ZW T5_56]|uniref:dihydrolipoamide acetyltransferase family protein n=1 Tax=Microbacterium sp. ZW T5_56 TaxID=3378081 RepID=UPI0038530A6C
MTSTTDFRLPDLGEGLPEAELIQWHVAVGDTVTINQPIAEVETAKAVVDLPSPYAGTVAALHAEAGTVVEVGSVLISFDTGGGAPEPTTDTVTDEVVPPNLVGYGAAPTSTARPMRKRRGGGETPSSSPTATITAPAPSTPAERAERPRSTPPVRRLARDLGVDLEQLTGTGPDGLITREDVSAAVGVAAPAIAPQASVADADEIRIPIRGVRKHTAAAMVRSAFTAPHVTCFHTVDVTETMALVRRLRDDRELAEHRIGPLAVVAKAVSLALRRTPELNSRWDEEAQEIVQLRRINLGIAAATPRGLVVPVIRDVGALALPGLSDAIRELAATARGGRTAPADMSGGTFSLTNIGTFGIEAGTPILNPGEAGILAIGAALRRPWEHDGEIALREVMTLSLSFDHRLVDGEQGARFLVDVARILEDPARALLVA